jgi:hypothetical protein
MHLRFYEVRDKFYEAYREEALETAMPDWARFIPISRMNSSSPLLKESGSERNLQVLTIQEVAA